MPENVEFFENIGVADEHVSPVARREISSRFIATRDCQHFFA